MNILRNIYIIYIYIYIYIHIYIRNLFDINITFCNHGSSTKHKQYPLKCRESQYPKNTGRNKNPIKRAAVCVGHGGSDTGPGFKVHRPRDAHASCSSLKTCVAQWPTVTRAVWCWLQEIKEINIKTIEKICSMISTYGNEQWTFMI